ncbi:MAG: translation initiation factor IF-2, partial [Waddliaceae bacterium]|nr:translation initiation factor IF-2 [Waddliaceae bacterium]
AAAKKSAEDAEQPKKRLVRAKKKSAFAHEEESVVIAPVEEEVVVVEEIDVISAVEEEVDAVVEEAPEPSVEEVVPEVDKIVEEPQDVEEPQAVEEPPAPTTKPSKKEKEKEKEKPLPAKKIIAARPRLFGPTGKHIKDLRNEAKKKEEEAAKKASDDKKKAAAKKKTTPNKNNTTNVVASVEPAKKANDNKEYPVRRSTTLRPFTAKDRRYNFKGGDESQKWRRQRRGKKSSSYEEIAPVRPKELELRLPISIKNLAIALKIKSSEIISSLFMQGMTVTLNDVLDDETTIQLIGSEFDCEITIDSSEEERIRITDKTVNEEISETDDANLIIRPPVVTFMGHVDHGKTSLIDAIRKSNIIEGEKGAITQHIGAFSCNTIAGDITIIDTPGHEAFSSMRARGAVITDIVILVIAGDEGIRQQTVEALNHAKEAGVTIVVAINKSDKPNFDAETVYRQLSDNELLPEAWGGGTITINCSAVTGEGIDALLEMVALQAEVLELKASPDGRARGSVIESEMHKGLGATATLLVQNGTLKKGDAVVFSHQWGRIKTMHDALGVECNDIGPSGAVEVAGLSDLPEAGSEFIVVANEREARAIAEVRASEKREKSLYQKSQRSLESIMDHDATKTPKEILNVILRADTQGSLEALKQSLLGIDSDKAEVNVVSDAVGEIAESDIELAAASDSTIIGFHTQIESHADSLIKQMKVTVRLHDIIYHAVDDTKLILTALLPPLVEEKNTGAAEVIATFKSSHLGVIAGCMVNEGTIHRNNGVRILRAGEEIWKGRMSSIKREKNDVKDISSGFECGILFNGYNDANVGDIVESFNIIETPQEL